MNFFSYKLDHDFGLAPNPFGGFCTLAVCKPSIRNNPNLNIGDWIIGTGSKHLKKLHYLIYAMKVEEKIDFNQYWIDSRFQYKKPVINGSLVQIYGDNIYHQDDDSKIWIQEESAHSIIDPEEHKQNDISGKWVLISREFYYLGDNCALIPERFLDVCCEARDMKYKDITNEFGNEFIEWVSSNFDGGISGDPLNWNEHNQLSLYLETNTNVR